MTSLAVVLVAAVTGMGVVLVVAGVGGRTVIAVAQRAQPGVSQRPAVRSHGVRWGAAGATATVAWLTTGWPVLAASGGAIGWWLPSALAAGRRHHRELELVEGIASWAEQLRDTISAANGLEHAIAATTPLAPRVLAPAVAGLSARMEYEPLPSALRRFADDVDHPLADFVVAALVTAARHQARELSSLLGHLATCAREEATMRTRVWVGRARSRSAVRIIVAVVVAFMSGLLVLDRSYLAAYDTADGQAVLAAVIATFGASFVAMDRMARLAVPERFVARRETEVSS